MTIAVIVGGRPNLMKAAPILAASRRIVDVICRVDDERKATTACAMP